MSLDAVIFDFDDTLVYSYATYEAATERFCQLLAERKLPGDAAAWAKYLHDQDIANVRRRGGVSHHCFTEAMAQTYAHFANMAGCALDSGAAARIEAIRCETYMAPPRVIDGAEEVLAALQGRARLFLLTEGDTEAQEARLQGSGLLPYFLDYAIVSHKDVAAYRRLLAHWRIDPARSWMVGNSIRSDMNPAFCAGLQTAHYLLPAWVYDRQEALGAPRQLRSLSDFLELIEHAD